MVLGGARSGGAGVADVGRQGNARRLEQWADDAGGGRAQGHLPPILADGHLLEPIEVAQHIAHSGRKPAARQRSSSSLRRIRARKEQNTCPRMAASEEW